MENASKALIIAGAILISILLIAISMYIYQSANSTIQTAASKMSQNDKNMYNSTVKNYSSKGTLNGTDIKNLIEDIISQNSQYVEESGKFISISTDDSVKGKGYTKADLDAKCQAANVYGSAADNASANNDAVNTQQAINEARDEMRKLSKVISSGKKYTVVEREKDGIIYGIMIKQL